MRVAEYLDASATQVDSLPLISVITTSFNRARYITETIESVLSQKYPRLEYIVIDGGSTDGSVEILQRYSPQLAYWVSEPDRGEAHALNKGFARCTGDLVAWLNSDDVYLPGALSSVGAAYAANPEGIIAGPVVNHWEATGREKVIQQRLEMSAMLQFWSNEWSWHQPGIFFSRRALTQLGSLLDESLNYCMDYDLVLRLLRTCKVSMLNSPLVHFRVHESAKGGGDNFDEFLSEWSKVSKRHWPTGNSHYAQAHDKYMSNRLAILFGQRLRRLQFRLAGRALVNAVRTNLVLKTFESLSQLSVGWLMMSRTKT